MKLKEVKNRLFHSKWKILDSQISDTFHVIDNRLEVSDKMKQEIDIKIMNARAEEEKYMKHISVKKLVIGVMAACLAVGTIGIAGSGIKNYVSHGMSFPDYTKFEDLSKAEETVGFSVKAVEEFSNGYQANGIFISDISILNEADQIEGEGKDLSIEYKKGSEQISLGTRKIFPTENANSMLDASSADKTMQCGDVTVIFKNITNKFVPPSYELTQEDKQNMELDNYNIAFGSQEVEIDISSHVAWIQDGIFYDLFGFNLTTTPDEMLQMAKEVIENEN